MAKDSCIGNLVVKFNTVLKCFKTPTEIYIAYMYMSKQCSARGVYSWGKSAEGSAPIQGSSHRPSSGLVPWMVYSQQHLECIRYAPWVNLFSIVSAERKTVCDLWDTNQSMVSRYHQEIYSMCALVIWTNIVMNLLGIKTWIWINMEPWFLQIS